MHHGLSSVLGVQLLLFSCFAWVTHTLWHTLSVDGQAPISLSLSTVVADCFTVTGLACLLLLLSAGYGIVRPVTAAAEKRVLVLCAVGFGSIYICWELFAGFFVLFAYVLAFVLFLRQQFIVRDHRPRHTTGPLLHIGHRIMVYILASTE